MQLIVQDTSSSTTALTSLQGTILYSSPGGIRLEYPLGMHICFVLQVMPWIYFIVV